MEQLKQFLKTAEKWDRKYLSAAKEAITALSPSEEIAERRIKKYLSKDRCNQFNLANSHSRALFRRHLLLAASELENDLYQSGRVVMMQRSSIKTGRFRTTKLSSTLRPLNRRSEMHLPEWII